MAETKIAFLGQCQTTGYKGVPAEASFPQVCRRAVQARRPGVTIDVAIEQYHHPAELPRATERVLGARPRVVVLEVVGWVAVNGRTAVDLSQLPRGIRTAYQRTRYFHHMSHLIAAKLPETAKLVERVQTSAHALATNVLGSLLPRYPRPTIEEYESLVDASVAHMQETPGLTVVVQGPGAPNLDLEARRLAGMPERYRAVEEMARRVAMTRGALYVDRWSTVDSAFYLPRSVRLHADGHAVWGNLLADELLAAGLV